MSLSTLALPWSHNESCRKAEKFDNENESCLPAAIVDPSHPGIGAATKVSLV